MKICFVHRHYPPVGGGGICTYIATLARGLVREGHTVHVIARAESGADRVEDDHGVVVHRLAPLSASPFWNRTWKVVGHGIRKVTGRFVNRLWASRRIGEKIEELNDHREIDLVESAEWEAELLWYLRHSKDRVPTVIKLHGPMEIIREVNRMKKDRAFDCLAEWEKEQTLKADFVSSPSRHLAEEMARRWGLRLDRIEIIPYPIDTDQFSPGANDLELDRPTVLYVGRLEKNKGTDVLFEAIPSVLESFPRARFRFIGSDTPTGEGGGSFQEQLFEGLPKELHASVEMVGAIPHDRLIDEYRQATLFVIPSLFDNFPNTCLEAMSCGSAIVGSDTGGIREMLDGGKCGSLFPPGDSNRLAECLIGLLQAPDRLKELGEKARSRAVSEYSLDTILERTVDYYERMVGVNRS
ncbi:MAG: glycosyltransferase family 4 protein [Candidatus Omnitrophica bacterium]|nr:glycosyltransferase family 4 protein [Candidatus Omnitrophota bacterium]